ncbi:MAG: hypothetical protein NW208_11080 [Bryobacter sp.]|nr:hypothetical protein [Bryobacter sp.]
MDLLVTWGPVLALILQAFLLSRFLDGKNRNYPLAIVYYVLLFFLTSVAILWQNGFAFLVKLFPQQRNVQFQSGLEVVIHVVLLALMFQLLRITSDRKGLPRTRLYLLAAITIALFAGTLYWVSGKNLGRQFSTVRQVMSFWMVLLNLYWWTLLVGQKKISRRILLLSSGIGLQMTGQVVADGLLIAFIKQADQYGLILFVYAMVFLTHYLSLAVWYEAFHPKHAQQEEPSLGMALPKVRNGVKS